MSFRLAGTPHNRRAVLRWFPSRRRALASHAHRPGRDRVRPQRRGDDGPRRRALRLAPSGNLSTPFTFSGTGFQPGVELEQIYTAPTGDDYSYFVNNQPAVVVVDADGRFSATVVPSRDFVRPSTGRWFVEFCYPGGDDCWTVGFDILP